MLTHIAGEIKKRWTSSSYSRVERFGPRSAVLHSCRRWWAWHATCRRRRDAQPWRLTRGQPGAVGRQGRWSLASRRIWAACPRDQLKQKRRQNPFFLSAFYRLLWQCQQFSHIHEAWNELRRQPWPLWVLQPALQCHCRRGGGCQ